MLTLCSPKPIPMSAPRFPSIQNHGEKTRVEHMMTKPTTQEEEEKEFGGREEGGGQFKVADQPRKTVRET